VGLLAPTSGTISVLGGQPGDGAAQLQRVGFVAQDTPTYARFSVAQHLRMGGYLNPVWDRELAGSRIDQLGIDPRQRAGSLSGGQQAQLALTLAIAKRPELLVLDEPVASLDPLARREFLQSLMEVVARDGLSVVLSSHLIADLQRVCDYLVLLVGSRVQVAGEVVTLLESHHRLSGPRRDPGSLPTSQEVIEGSHTGKQSTFLVRTDQPILDPAWTVRPVTLDDLVLAYMSRARDKPGPAARPGGGAMIRYAWMQFRTQTLVAVGGLAVVAVAALITGPHLAHLYNTMVATCGTHGDCPAAQAAFLTTDRALYIALNVAVIVAPSLIGIFWGAPLVAHELETGTYRLAWTQGVTRTRWLAAKLGLGTLASMAAVGLLSLMATWWASRTDQVTATLFASFDERDIVPAGYAAFAFVLGVTAGMLIRRTLPAMAVTLATFFAVREAFSHWARPYLIAPLRLIAPDTTLGGSGKTPPAPGGLTPRDWIISNQTINRAGQVIGQGGYIGGRGLDFNAGRNGLSIHGAGSCPNIKVQPFRTSQAHVADAIQQCIDQLRIREAMTYQPASRYWPFQWYELAIYLGLALVLGGFCFWWFRRRIA
jgi:ABC-2 type transport system ATP-binding protein